MDNQLEGNLRNMYGSKYVEQEMVRNLGNKLQDLAVDLKSEVRKREVLRMTSRYLVCVI